MVLGYSKYTPNTKKEIDVGQTAQLKHYPWPYTLAQKDLKIFAV